MNEDAFLLLAIAFVLFVTWLIVHTSNVDYERTLNERREFGYRDDPRHHPIEKPKKK